MVVFYHILIFFQIYLIEIGDIYMVEQQITKQTLFLENKNYLKITGVKNVINLTETFSTITIGDEILQIKGNNIKAEKLSVECGELILIGNFIEFKFEKTQEKKSFFKRIFK